MALRLRAYDRGPHRSPVFCKNRSTGDGDLDRYATFVDAGYVFAAGGELCCGTGDRKGFKLDVAKLGDYLNQIAEEATGLPALRMYWYDAAPYTGRTDDHRRIALLPNIKLRLGRIKSNRQKGVDALIYHDLVNLARERAISDAFLVSGDEDLREGVRTIQGMGVRVTLVGIPPTRQSTNQSFELVEEADEVVTLAKDVLAPFFRLKPRPTNKQRHPAKSEDADADAVTRTSSSTTAVAREAGSSLAETLRGSPSLESVLRAEPRIPPEIDRQLLYSLRQQLATQDVPEHLKRAARASFWNTLTDKTEGLR